MGEMINTYKLVVEETSWKKLRIYERIILKWGLRK
jgi:hypothetical protein